MSALDAFETWWQSHFGSTFTVYSPHYWTVWQAAYAAGRASRDAEVEAMRANELLRSEK
jgi:hypothetical protein